MALHNLTPITKLATFKASTRNPVVQVQQIERTERRHLDKLWLSDGSDFHVAYVDSTLKKSKQLEEGCFVRMWEYLRAKVGDTMVIKILDLDVIPNIMPLDLTLRPIWELKTDKSSRVNPNPVVQVIEVKKTENDKYKLLLSDGFYYHEAFADDTLKKSKPLEEDFIIRLAKYLRMSVNNTMVIKVLDIDVICTQCDIIGHPKPFPYSATPSAEDYLKGSCSSVEDQLEWETGSEDVVDYIHSEDEHSLGDQLEWETDSSVKDLLEWETESEDVDDSIYDSLPEDGQPLLKGSCSWVEDQVEWETKTEDVVDYTHENLPEDEHPVSCSWVEDQLETEDGFLLLEKVWSDE